MLVHASCVCWQNKGILFIGDSGNGKSTAALALIEKGATLVADDYVEINLKNGKIHATCPKNIFGKITYVIFYNNWFGYFMETVNSSR